MSNEEIEHTHEDGTTHAHEGGNTEHSHEDVAPSTPAFGVADLKLMANVLEVVSNRGAIRANEMTAVGNLYNNLMGFLIANGAVQVPQPEVSEDAPVGEDTDEEIAQDSTEE